MTWTRRAVRLRTIGQKRNFTALRLSKNATRPRDCGMWISDCGLKNKTHLAFQSAIRIPQSVRPHSAIVLWLIAEEVYNPDYLTSLIISASLCVGFSHAEPLS